MRRNQTELGHRPAGLDDGASRREGQQPAVGTPARRRRRQRRVGQAPWRGRAVGGHGPDLAVAPVLGLDDERAHERHGAAVGRQRGAADGLDPVVVGELDRTRAAGWAAAGAIAATTIAAARNSGRIMRTSEECRRKCAVYRTSIASQPRPTPIPGAGAWPQWHGVRAEAKREGHPLVRMPFSAHATGTWAVLGRGGRPSGPLDAAALARGCTSRASCGRGAIAPTATARAGLRPVDATSSAPGANGVRVRNGPSARPRVARWITARDDCHVRPPFRTGACGRPGSSGPVA